MLLSLSWLRDFVPYEGPAAELGAMLTMAGLEMDGLFRPYEHLRAIVTGHVVACGPHPEADKLSLCRVDIGSEVLDIVCGAPNVAQGQKVAVATVGVTLPSGLTIKKAKLRGAPSNGMICSEQELDLSDEHDGILVLDDKTAVGLSLLDALHLDDEVLDISITPNRGDCLSVLGLAREAAAITGLPLRLPAFHLEESGPDMNHELALEVPDPSLCSLYQGRVIEGAAVRPSPAALRYRLNAIGVRPISNLVDVTNYILMELGQPLHAFDLDCVRGGRIIVRAADSGERLTTLDGQERQLLQSDITIRDAERAIGLGGVMGGLNSEISATSSRVFLECAVFTPSLIRRTARRLALHSEAAYRFERGVDQGGASYALERAAAMMAELSGGRVRTGLLKTEPRPWQAPVVRLRRQRAANLLGVSPEPSFYADTLRKLGCTVTAVAGNEQDEWDVVPPSFRRDLSREADLIEEVVRVYGVDRVPATLPVISRQLERAGEPETRHDFIGRIKHWGRGAGLHEAVNYSFVSHKELDQLGVHGDGRVSIMNPLSDEMNVLRTDLAPGLLNSLRNNLSQGAGSVRLFETAAVFAADKSSETTVCETPRLGILLSGARFDQAWPQAGGELDYYDLKGVIEHLLLSFSLGGAVFRPAGDGDEVPVWLAPCVMLSVGEVPLGRLGRVKGELADPYHAKKPVWLAELDIDALYALSQAASIRFAPLPVFPPVRRDITCIAAPGVTAAAILAEIEKLRLPLLASVRLIDYFEPEGRDEKNLTFRLTFRHADRTLKDAEADKQRDAVATALQKLLPIRI